MLRDGVERELAGGHREVEEEVVVAADEGERLGHVGRVDTGGDHGRGEVAQHHQRAGPVAVVGLVAHLQHLGEDAGDVDAARGAHRLLQQRREHVAHPAQPLDDVGGVGAVAQHLAEPLVERAVGTPPGGPVLEHPDPHARRGDAGHRSDRGVVVAGVEADLVTALEQRGRVVGVVDQSFEGGRSQQGAAHRAGGSLPGDRRTGVQELSALEAEHLRRRRDVDQVGGHAEHRLEGALVGRLAARVGGDGREVGLGAGHRRAPVDAGDVDGLGLDGIREQVGADVDDAHDAPSSELDRAPGGGGVGQIDLGARVGQCLHLAVASPWGSPSVPTTVITTGFRMSAIAGREQRGRVGFGAVAEHHVEQQDRGVGVGGSLGDVLEPDRRVDHRVSSSGRVLVVAEVDEAVAGAGRPGAPPPAAGPRWPGCRRRRARAGTGRRTPAWPSR